MTNSRLNFTIRTLFCILCFIFSFHSQSNAEQAPTNQDGVFKNAGKDFISPVTTKAKYVFYSGAALTLVLVALEDEISDPTQKDVVEDHPLGHLSRLGNLAGQMYPNFLYIFGMLTHGAVSGNQKSYDRASLMFKSTFYSSALTTTLKYTVREPRPKGNNRDAFPSGHTTTAFSFASVIGAEHEWPYGVAAYTLASFVGFSRMNDNQHLLHQVVGGAVIGASYGLGLYYREQDKKAGKITSTEPESMTVVQILPTERMDGAMLFLGSEF